MAVPSDYKRAEGDEADMVTYADPSGVFEITFWHRVAEAADESPGADAKARNADYEKGGENTTSMEDAVVKDHGLTYQGRAATEMDTEYTPYGATEDDPVRYRFLELLIPGEKKTDPYWHVRVKTPAAGQARTDGATIFDEVKAHFKIRGSRARKPRRRHAVRCIATDQRLCRQRSLARSRAVPRGGGGSCEKLLPTGTQRLRLDILSAP
ncbi:hypothetical protein ACIBQ3_29760 [Streptomyces rubiginosohelvolus]|uniref:hypothetical protein n=1 Tax=Streptomyces rubiginosohelvolus TaxID=67362 RepID=UPI00378E7078